jgi:nucleoside-diphosphate kinase
MIPNLLIPQPPAGEAALETTFALIKSHAVRANLVGLVLSRILREKLIIMTAVAATLTSEQILDLYSEHRKKRYWPQLVDSVSGPVVAMVIGGRDAVKAWRGVLGATDPGFADKGTLRAEYGNVNLVAENVAHGSEDATAARREIALFFPRIVLSWR